MLVATGDVQLDDKKHLAALPRNIPESRPCYFFMIISLCQSINIFCFVTKKTWLTPVFKIILYISECHLQSIFLFSHGPGSRKLSRAQMNLHEVQCHLDSQERRQFFLSRQLIIFVIGISCHPLIRICICNFLAFRTLCFKLNISNNRKHGNRHRIYCRKPTGVFVFHFFWGGGDLQKTCFDSQNRRICSLFGPYS